MHDNCPLLFLLVLDPKREHLRDKYRISDAENSFIVRTAIFQSYSRLTNDDKEDKYQNMFSNVIQLTAARCR